MHELGELAAAPSTRHAASPACRAAPRRRRLAHAIGSQHSPDHQQDEGGTGSQDEAAHCDCSGGVGGARLCCGACTLQTAWQLEGENAGAVLR